MIPPRTSNSRLQRKPHNAAEVTSAVASEDGFCTKVRMVLTALGGPNSVSWPTFWATYLLFIVGHFFASSPISLSIGARFGIITLVQLLSFTPLLLRHWLSNRQPDARPRPVRALALASLSGILRGFLLSFFLLLLSAEDDPQFLLRSIRGLIVVLVVVVVMAVIVNGYRSHAQRIAELLGIRAALMESRARIDAQAQSRNEEIVERIQSVLARGVAALDEGLPEAKVAQLQRMATDIVRPMSHEMSRNVPSWKPEIMTSPPRFELRPILLAATTGRPFAPLLTGLTLLLMGVASSTTLVPGAALPFNLVAFWSPLILLAVANRVVVKFPSSWGLAVRSLAVVALLISAAGITSFVAVWAAQGAGDTSSVSIAVLVFAAAFAGLFVLTNAVQTVQEQVAESLAKSTAELRWSIARVGQVLWFQQKKLARALHGPVQSRITAAAIRMDAVVRAGGDPEPLLVEVRVSIVESLGLLSATPDLVTSLQLSVDRLIGTWDGVAHIEVEIEEEARVLLVADPIAETCVADALNEAISNAVRHGGADRVDVLIDCQRSSTDVVVLLRVEDHGPESIDHTKKGLGSQIPDETSVAWSLDQLGEGHILNAEFPVSVG